MALPFRVRQTAATAGTGDITITGVDAALYATFASMFGTGTARIGYGLVGPTSNKFYEVGITNFNGTTNILSRTVDSQVLISSNAGNRVNIPPAVTYDVYALDLGGPQIAGIVTTPFNMNKTHLGNIFAWQCASNGSIVLPDVQYAAFGAFLTIHNTTAQFNCTIAAVGGQTLWGSSSWTLYPGEGVFVYGTNGQWYGQMIAGNQRIFYTTGGDAFKTVTRIFYNASDPVGSGWTPTDGDIWFQP